jgi:Serine carboxypeptidase
MLAGREFYVTGESYAGVYIPAVSLHLMDLLQQGAASPFNGLGFNFQGFSIGNGLLAWRWDDATSIDFFYFHGIISYNSWNDFKSSCCDPPGDVSCQIVESRACYQLEYDIQSLYYDAMYYGHSDIYNVYQQCYELSDDSGFPLAASFLNSTKAGKAQYTRDRMARMRTQMALRQSRGRSSKKPAQRDSSSAGNITTGPAIAYGQHLLLNYGSNDEAGGYPCSGGDVTNAYLQQRYVREALHVPDYVQDWTACA